MKIAKADEADLDMAMTLTGYLNAIEGGWVPSDLADDEDGCEEIDTDSQEQYERLIDGLGRLLRNGSIGRVVWGMATICDPANKLLDPESDVLEIHPDLAGASEQRDELLSALEDIAAYPQARTDEISATGLRDIARRAIAKVKAQA